MGFRLRYQQHEFDLTEGQFLIGRSPECQLSLDDPLVSRAHAALVVTGDEVTLEDLGSRNGVRVNGQRIQGVTRVSHADRIMIGSQELALVVDDPPAGQTQVQAARFQGSALGLLAGLADKAIALGRGDEAERILGGQLEALLRETHPGADPAALERAARYALKVGATTGRARWFDYVIRLYAAAALVCPAAVADELYAVLGRVRAVDLAALREYLAWIRSREGLGPAERFTASRLEGLERVAAVK